MNRRAAPWIAVACLGAAAVLSILLGASLDQVTLREGIAYLDEAPDAPRPAMSSRVAAGAHTPLQPIDYILAYGPVALIVGGVLVYVISQLKTRMGHRRPGAARLAIIILLTILAIAFAVRTQIQRALEEPGVPIPAEQVAQPNGAAAPVPTARIGPNAPAKEAHAASNLLQVAFALLAVGATAGVVVAALRLHKAKPRLPARREPTLRDSVELAVRSLRMGRDAAGVVERCYRDMMQAYAQSAGVAPGALTPREFARALGELGLGGEALDELTALFELVHYGRRDDDPLAPRALRCLTQLEQNLAAETPSPA